MNSEVLITGGGGYIGSVLVETMLGQGYRVTVVDDFRYCQSSLAHLMQFDSLTIINADVRELASYQGSVKTADIIIPLAALVGAPLCAKHPEEASSINKSAIFSLFDLVSGGQLVVMPTTNSAYGSGDEDNFCTEESPLNPISHYAVEKVEVERRLMDKENAISFRLATVFGMSPRMRLDLLVNDFVYRAVHDRAVVLFESHFKRNYIHVRDVVSAFLFGIENSRQMSGQVYNVGLSEANLSKWELCEEIKKQVPEFTFIEATIGKDPDQRNYVVSNEKIEALGYKPQVGIQQGIRELRKGFSVMKRSQYANI